MKRVFFLLLILATPIMAFCQYSKVSFYIAAHPDDWQLFIGARAFGNIQEATAPNSDKKVVLIYVTSGDGNCNGGPLDTNYYRARMAGADRSVQFCADINSVHATWTTDVVTVKGKQDHQIRRSVYKNIVSYYLLLPDGCFEQKATTLTKFAQHAIPTLDAIDSSTSYHGYNDLVQTIRGIFRKEADNVQKIVVHAQEWDQGINPRDHPDHMAAGKLANSAIGGLKLPLFLYSGYCTSDKAINLQTKDVAREAALVSQIRSTMMEWGYAYGWDPGHTSHALRNYYREYKPTDISDTGAALQEFLEQGPMPTSATADNVYPNPSSSGITVTYNMPEAGAVKIMLYNAPGNLVACLSNVHEARGNYSVQFDVSSLPAGVYIVVICKQGEIHHLKFEKE